MDVVDRHVNVGGINTRYWVRGDQGSDVFLVHGLGGYAENWLSNFETLSLNHRVYAFDLPGHGLSSKPLNVPYTFEYFATFIRDFMQAIGVEHAHIIGSSLGGGIATQLAIRHPKKVDTLTLVSSAGLGKELDLATRLITIPRLGEKMTSPNRKGIKAFYNNIVFDPSLIEDAFIDLHLKMASQPSAQAATLLSLRTFANLWGQKKQVYTFNINGLMAFTKPLFILWGRNDPVVPVSHAESLAKRIPGARLKIFERCKHMVMLEHSQEFNKTVLDWIAPQNL